MKYQVEVSQKESAWRVKELFLVHSLAPDALPLWLLQMLGLLRILVYTRQPIRELWPILAKERERLRAIYSFSSLREVCSSNFGKENKKSKNYLLLKNPRMPRSFKLKLHGFDRVLGGSNWYPSICVSAAINSILKCLFSHVTTLQCESVNVMYIQTRVCVCVWRGMELGRDCYLNIQTRIPLAMNSFRRGITVVGLSCHPLINSLFILCKIMLS